MPLPLHWGIQWASDNSWDLVFCELDGPIIEYLIEENRVLKEQLKGANGLMVC